MKTDKDETYNTKGSRKGAPREDTDSHKPNLKGMNRNPGKSGNGKHKVGDGNPFAKARGGK